ncbi:unnamed protein product [Tenebrio molitor]|nr:unnamed protein product [Tenebrio molitor]
MEGALFKKVDTTALFCRPNKRSPDEPSETEVNADISSFQWPPDQSYTTEKIQRQFTNRFTCKKPNPSKMTEHRRL